MAYSTTELFSTDKLSIAQNKLSAIVSQIPPALWGILLLALFLRLGMVFYVPISPEHWKDASNYHYIAKSLSEGNGYSMGGGEPTRMRPPTYPVFLAIIYFAFGPNPKIATCIQSFLGLLTVILAFVLGKRIFNHRAGLVSALIVATYPALLFYDTRLLREGFTATLIIATIVLAVDSKTKRATDRRALLTGLMLAMTSMSRPETLLLTAPIFYLLARPIHPLKQLWRPALLVALPILLMWIPWSVRNYVCFGSISPVRQGLGSVLWFGSRWAAIDGDNHTDAARNALQKLNQKRYGGLADGEVDKRYMADALKDIEQRPEWFVHMIGKKMILFWRDANGVKKTLPAIHPILPYLLNSYYYALLVLAAGAALWLCRKREWVVPLAAMVITYMMIYALLHVRNRYRVPILPIVFVLSAGGITALYDLMRAKFSRSNTTAE